jgi:zinc protease
MIRQERGYNYGDYSYIEHWDGRTGSLFQIFNQPRKQQYFSLWVRPVQHEYAYPLMKAITYELDRLITEGLTDEDVREAKNKSKVLYVNLGETVGRLLSAKMDDSFHGMDRGFLESYLENIDKVTTAQVNEAVRRHLQTRNVKYVVVTSSEHAAGLAAQIRANESAQGKSFEEYEFPQVKKADGTVEFQIPAEKREMVARDALWAAYPLNIGSVRLVPVNTLFKTGQFTAE